MKYYGKIGTNEQQVLLDDSSAPDGFIEMQTERPTPEHIAQENGTWALTIDMKKLAKRQEINEAWHLAEKSGMYYKDKIIDTDTDSWERLRNYIDIAEQETDLEKVLVSWKCQDNTYIDLTVADLRALPTERANFNERLFLRTQELKEQVEAATTIEEVEQINWTTPKG